MTAYPVARYLIEFGREAEEIAVPAAFDTVLQPLSSKPEEAPDTHELLLDAAREEGRNEVRAQAQTLINDTLTTQKRDFEIRLVEERKLWVETESAKWTLGLANAIAQLEARLAEGVDAVLRPFLIETLRRQMIDELAHNVGILLNSDENPAIEISGAADLLTALREKLSAVPAAIDYKPNESIDVRIVAHHTIIESQLRAWIERFDLSQEQH